MKRHFEPGLSSRSPREAYRIDRTSADGSGLTADDGNQRREGFPEQESPVSNADIRGYSIRTGGQTNGD